MLRKIQKRLLILGLCIFAVTFVVSFKTMFMKPALKKPEIEEHQGIPIAHASPGKKTGCASCHTKPIDADCSECHETPPTEIDDISFPHHDPAPGGPLDTCKSCHAGTDARYAEVPPFEHGYCDDCHDLEHSEPP